MQCWRHNILVVVRIQYTNSAIKRWKARVSKGVDETNNVLIRISSVTEAVISPVLNYVNSLLPSHVLANIVADLKQNTMLINRLFKLN